MDVRIDIIGVTVPEKFYPDGSPVLFYHCEELCIRNASSIEHAFIVACRYVDTVICNKGVINGDSTVYFNYDRDEYRYIGSDGRYKRVML